MKPVRPIEFLQGFLRNPLQVASVVPSSRFLARRVRECADVASARVIVELGPGTGAMTGQILDRMPANGHLIAIEINSDFAQLLREEFPDPRLSVFEGSSTRIEDALGEAGEESADLVVSGIPFSTLEDGDGTATLEAAKRVLAPGGRFVAYQFRNHVARYAEPVFGAPETHSGFWNIPPMKIYVWGQSSPAA
ncbi:MAG: methyltransferase domain-containing protein [Proteobacteria bacterium]|nr:methyltransferase domain-containing protein [Pseudomonadota bacterium]